MKARILIVDDEARMAEALAIALRRDGHLCATCTSGEAALERFDAEGADVVITDRRMPGIDGVELMRQLQQRSPALPVILITAFGDVRSAVAAMRDGAFDYLTKPFDNNELRSLVNRALELERLKRENHRLREELSARYVGSVIAESEAMRQALERLDRAAASHAPVLIEGESGTGKEVLAKRLHYGSPRLGRPFVAVNCKAFAPGVLESELFGHEKGAFTGAATTREGCFERADGGTLFLDEIGEIDVTFQAKLLRVLQENEVLRVGGDHPIVIDVRIVAATNRDLRRAIREGSFREDLFYRLNVIPVHLAPLRQRQADILPLARHFLAGHDEGNRRFELGEDAARLLSAHTWPGNVRELQNVIERAVVFANASVITADDLMIEDIDPRSPDPVAGHLTLQEHLDRSAADRIRSALNNNDGRRTDAARELGVDRTTLFRWMRRLGM